MGRPVTFDRQQVLEKATRLFWHKGYDSTPVSELLRVMSIQRSSFYHAWGDKRSLFLLTLDHYFQRSLKRIRARRVDPHPQALREHVQRMIMGDTGEPGRDGCLLVNTVLEQSGLDEALAGRARFYLEQLQKEFEIWIQAMQEAGNLPESPDAHRRACSLMCLIKGLRVMAREGVEAQTLTTIIDDFFQGWLPCQSR